MKNVSKDMLERIEYLRFYYMKNHEFPENEATEILNIITSLLIRIERLEKKS